MKFDSPIIIISVLILIKAKQIPCDKKFNEDKSLIELTSSVNQFSKNFVKYLRVSQSGNYAVSPLNLHVALGIISIGSGGSTSAELHRILGTNNFTNRVVDDYKKLSETLLNISSNLQLSQKIWLPKNFNWKVSFVSLLRYGFKNAAIGVLNFGNPQSVADVANCRFRICSIGSFMNLTNLGKVSRNSSLIISSVLNFKEIMSNSLQVTHIEIRKFFINERISKSVPMMRVHGQVIYGILPKRNVSFIKYELKGKKLSMIIIRSNRIQDFREVDQQLDNINISSFLERGNLINMSFFLPKFKIESTLESKEIVQKMGALQIFSSSANFSGISDRRLKIDGIIQKVSIDINESEAIVSSSTNIQYLKRTPRTTTELFYINSPFHFVIFHDSTNLLLIRGRVMNPLLS